MSDIAPSTNPPDEGDPEYTQADDQWAVQRMLEQGRELQAMRIAAATKDREIAALKVDLENASEQARYLARIAEVCGLDVAAIEPNEVLTAVQLFMKGGETCPTIQCKTSSAVPTDGTATAHHALSAVGSNATADGPIPPPVAKPADLAPVPEGTPITDAAIVSVDVAFDGGEGLSSSPEDWVSPEVARQIESDLYATQRRLIQNAEAFVRESKQQAEYIGELRAKNADWIQRLEVATLVGRQFMEASDKKIADLERELAMATDAANKGDTARSIAGAQEERIRELECELEELKKAIIRSI